MDDLKIKFLEFQYPTLQSGDYEIIITQNLEAGNKIVGGNGFTTRRPFSVAGERFTLPPNLINTVYPPNGSRGEHTNVLPHIILERSTLPWERSIDGAPDGPPWLALLLFDENKNPEVSSVKLGDLITASTSSPFFPGLTVQASQTDEDMVTVIDVEKELLQQILPNKKELNYLSHVRQIPAVDDRGEIIEGEQKELAVIITNRFPKTEAYSTVHLVALEGRYENGEDGEFIYPEQSNPESKIRLVTLKNWTFYSDVVAGFKFTTNAKRKLLNQSFSDSDLLDALESDDAILNEEIIGDDTFIGIVENKLANGAALESRDRSLLLRYCGLPRKNFTGLLLNIDREPSVLQPVRGETPADAVANSFLTSGYVPVKHHFRTGRKAVSWYRSPLLPGPDSNEDLDLDILSADALLRFDHSTGLLDVTYSAAWQLGRLLLLRDSSIAQELFKWKRQNMQKVREIESALEHLIVGEEVPVELPESVKKWFEEKRLLKDVPFSYLVPEDSMLPPESLRFFQLDLTWVDALLDGAYSIGRVTTADVAQDHEPILDPEEGTISGFLLRSQVVAGWPNLLVEGYGSIIDHDDFEANAEKIKLLRMDRLSSDLLFCLFEGELQTIDIHQQPGALHYGVDELVLNDQGLPVTFKKEFRKGNGELSGVQEVFSDLWKSQEQRVINIEGLFDHIDDQTSLDFPEDLTTAQFSLAMIEGAQKVRFFKTP